MSLLFAMALLVQDKPPEPPKPAELKVLEPLIGTWDMEMTQNPAVWTPKEVKTRKIITREWTLNGRFIQEKEISAEPPGAVWNGHLWTYESSRKAYRWWFFYPEAVHEFFGHWDDASKSMTWTWNTESGIIYTATWHPGSDTEHWKLIAKDKDGKVYLDLESRNKRRK